MMNDSQTPETFHLLFIIDTLSLLKMTDFYSPGLASGQGGGGEWILKYGKGGWVGNRARRRGIDGSAWMLGFLCRHGIHNRSWR